jgi:hypothetical protein
VTRRDMEMSSVRGVVIPYLEPQSADTCSLRALPRSDALAG